LSQQDFSFAKIIPILIQTLSSMANNEKSFFDGIKKVFIVLIIVAIVYTWFLLFILGFYGARKNQYDSYIR